MKLARDGTGHDIVPRRVSFAHPSPLNDQEHRRFFGTRVRFGASTNSLLLHARDARRPLQDADEALAAIVRRRLERVLAVQDARASGPLAARVRRVLVESLGKTSVTPESIAEALGTTRRTLSRRLASEKTSFREFARWRAGRVRTRHARGPGLECRRRRVLPRLLGTRGIPSRLPAMDRPDADASSRA